MKILTIEIQPLNGYWGSMMHLCSYLEIFKKYGHTIDLYTKAELPFTRIKKREIQDILDIKEKYDIVIGTPSSCMIAKKISEELKAECYIFVFDMIPYSRELPTHIQKQIYNGRYIDGGNVEEKLLAQSCEGSNIIVSTKWAKEYIQKTKWICPKHIIVAPPLIRNDRDSFIINEKIYDVCVIGRIVPYKGVEDCINISQNLNLKMALITDKPIEKDNVKCFTNISETEKFSIIRSSKIMLSASVWEGYGMFVAEAMYCDIPFIGYDLPTFDEITKGKGCILTKLGDVDGLKTRVKVLLENYGNKDQKLMKDIPKQPLFSEACHEYNDATFF